MTPWALLVLVVANVVALVKMLTPKIFDAFISQKEQDYEAERQDDVAMWSNIMLLQKETTAQNKKLIDYFIHDLRSDLAALRSDLERFDGKLDANLKDIDKRWLASSKELGNLHNQQRILTSEISHLSETLENLRNRLTYASAFVEGEDD